MQEDGLQYIYRRQAYDMEFVFNMRMTGLGPFDLRERVVTTNEGMRACQDYGKAIGKELGGK